MSRWKQWAESSLKKLDEKAQELEAKNTAAARAALEHVRETGVEPYFSLKAFVAVQLETEND